MRRRKSSRTRLRVAVLIAVVAVSLVLISQFALALVRSFTYISCTYNVVTFTIDGHQAGQTWESDSGCYAGTNVGVQMRWKNTGCPAYWIYSVQQSAPNSITQVLQDPVCVHHVSGRGRNAYPDSWSSWSSFG